MNDSSFEFLGLWLLIAFIGGCGNALLYPLVRRYLTPLRPAVRSGIRLAYASSAPFAALLAVILITQVSIAGILIPLHCHNDQCTAHAPVVSADSALLFGAVTISSLALAFALLFMIWVLRRTQRRIWLLWRITRHAPQGYRLIDSGRVFACCVGLLKPQILVSSALVNALNDEELEVVLSHERAHAARYDNLRALILRWFTLLWPPVISRQLLNDSRADAEQACDLRAAKQVGHPDLVGLIVKKLSALAVERPALSEGHIAGAGFHCGNDSARLTLLQQHSAFSTLDYLCILKACTLLLVLWCLQVLVLSTVTHNFVEWLA